MDFQLTISLLVVTVAVGLLLRRCLKWANGNGESACSGCSKAGCRTGDSATVSSGTIITEDEISLPSNLR